MHNNFSPHAPLVELKETMRFIDEYYKLYSQWHEKEWKRTVVFTGGEPTVNPDFYKLIDWIKSDYPDYNISLTTNGTWDKRKIDLINSKCDNVTISYHTEGRPKLKKKVVENILALHKLKPYNMRVNVMMHSGDDNFKECQDLIKDVLEPNGIKFVPRIIGERIKSERHYDRRDPDSGRRKVHEYSNDQRDYMQSFWNHTNNKVAKTKTTIELENVPNKKTVLRKMGRGCCGNIDLDVKTDGNWDKTRFLSNTNFKGWKCLVNWYFLHIEQENDLIYHHQTCRTNLDSEVGPIGTISEREKLLDRLRKEMYINKGLPYITCPNDHCGCGICAPKAKNMDDAVVIWKKYISPELNPL
jgi:MoaA/NifB/PqqE/SkfB family radical SAM enzyme